MTYPCGLIRDLLPLYLDDVCQEDSKQAVEQHLSACEKCRQYYESMKSIDGFAEKQHDNSEDMRLADGLKRIKMKINKKIRNIILCSAAAAVFLIIGFNALCTVPIKSIDLKKVTVSAAVYPINELPHTLDVDQDSVTISLGEADTSDTYRITIPDMSNAKINMTENVMEHNEFVTVISWSSPYLIREIKSEYQGDTLYVTVFQTTVLNNKAPANVQTTQSLEFKEINQIVFVEEDGKETVLWSR